MEDISAENLALEERGRYQIETFEMRFGHSYRALLNYAAIPVVIAPELLNYLRVQFTPKLPWVAEVDLLLSDLFRTVGYEQYAMQSYVRAVLLESLETNLGKKQMEAAAELLIGYVAQLKHHNPYLSDRELKRQRWSAMVFIDARKADVVNELSNEFDRAISGGEVQSNLLEVVTITEQLAPYLKEVSESVPLINNARKIGQIIRDRTLTETLKVEAIARQLQVAHQTSNLPLLQEFDFEIAEIVFEEKPATPKQQLEEFKYEVGTLEVVPSFNLSLRINQRKIRISQHERQGQQFVENLDKNIRLEMVEIPAGSFIMGAAQEEEESEANERPQHEVNISTYFLGKYPITQAQYEAVMGNNPSSFKDKPDSPKHPVEQVSWDDAVEFCQRLSKQTGKEYHLPSESEWEYACRATTSPPTPLLQGEGSKQIYPPFHFGETLDAKVANYNTYSTYGRGQNAEYRKKNNIRRQL